MNRGSNAHEQCVIRCPVSSSESVITWKFAPREPGITIQGFQLTGLAQL